METNCRDCGETFESKCEWLTTCYECVKKSMNYDEKEWVWQSGHYAEEI